MKSVTFSNYQRKPGLQEHMGTLKPYQENQVQELVKHIKLKGVLCRGGHITGDGHSLGNLSPDCRCVHQGTDKQRTATCPMHGLQFNSLLSVNMAYLNFCLVLPSVCLSGPALCPCVCPFRPSLACHLYSLYCRVPFLPPLPPRSSVLLAAGLQKG